MMACPTLARWKSALDPKIGQVEAMLEQWGQANRGMGCNLEMRAASSPRPAPVQAIVDVVEPHALALKKDPGRHGEWVAVEARYLKPYSADLAAADYWGRRMRMGRGGRDSLVERYYKSLDAAHRWFVRRLEL